ncbi:hypothetical protein A3C37_04720 [Candidatus Peribacteria bacterium RIFCSPHIGHO2_02_FULL_53_20]|nr:MAG: hypothetical protein A3C37_04720 [Candidatus Peribacteria bacterium RIFCSPHIGHO2_02_FULL_53_20]OGJ70651.1 MAG: hypothetical protein A3G69_04430 [Candidatus Peribacteria bacterium RIFCSPLOWO2_12_FULL_53_10]
MEQTKPATATSVHEHALLKKVLRTLHLWEFGYHVREFFCQLLRVDYIRRLVDIVRYLYYAGLLRRMRILEPDGLRVDAVKHNMAQMRKWMGVSRSNHLLYPLSALHLSKASPVLSIGPRTEGEILNLMAMGFHNVRAVDLISYSPWVDLGDMHAMPYKDHEFAIVIMGWVLAYSLTQEKAAQEVIRVTRNGGIIVVGVQYHTKTLKQFYKKLESVQEILALFAPHVDRVLFSQDLPDHPCTKWELMVMFSIKK